MNSDICCICRGAAIASILITMNLHFYNLYYDQETELHYNFFRDYNPKNRRYIQINPIGLDIRILAGKLKFPDAYNPQAQKIDPSKG